MRIKVSDYVCRFIASRGVRDVFLVSGGGMIHLCESVGRCKDLRFFCNYNEQATSYCAEGYARLKNGPAVCLVTTGPGSTNAISGVAGAWMDSVPVIVISGQVKRELLADYSRVRQVGEQEVNIIEMVRPVTKYAKTVMEPGDIRLELEKAFYEAVNPRFGPVWLNLPLDVQGSFVEEKELKGFIPEEKPAATESLSRDVAAAVGLLKAARRPLLLCGFGVRLAVAEELLRDVLKVLRIPVVLSFNGMDLLAEDHPLLVGKPGIIGQRRANFAVQNADCILSVGSRLNLKIVGYHYQGFAPRARKILVDIDPEEMRKQTLRADLMIRADAGNFLKEFLRHIEGSGPEPSGEWLEACRNWKKRYPSVTDDFFQDKGHVNTYVFFDRLSDLLEAQVPVITGNGLSALCLYQAFKVRDHQRAFTNNGYGAMGWGLPAAIGACIANGCRTTVCVTGDGSFQMNIQELALIRHHRLPLKIFILNNRGYTSIRLTQDTFFKGHYVGADAASGVEDLNVRGIAGAYGLGYERIAVNEELTGKIKDVLSSPGAVLCELNIAPDQGIMPKTTSFQREDGRFESRPLEDMFPFLSREELAENMNLFSRGGQE